MSSGTYKLPGLNISPHHNLPKFAHQQNHLPDLITH